MAGTAGSVIGVLGAAAQGAGAGAALGPYGAIAGAVIGLGAGIFGVIGQNQAADAEKAQIELQKKQALDQLNEARQQAEVSWSIAKSEAGKNADIADRQIDRQSDALSAAVGRYEEQANSQLDSIARQNLSDSMSVGSSISDAYAAQGWSGTRGGGTASEAISMQAQTAQNQLTEAARARKTQSETSIAEAYAGFKENFAGLADARADADSLRRSYEEGGSAYAQRQMQLQSFSNQQNQIIESSGAAMGQATPTDLDYFTGAMQMGGQAASLMKSVSGLPNLA